MNAFAQFFLNEDWQAVPNAPHFYLSGFGKHPGWRDHLDDIGLATASLIEARRIIYGGIAYQIESAIWEKAGTDKVSAGFEHVIHWSRMNESLTGLIWSSQDGKGRSLYPMIVLAHGVDVPSGRLAGELLPGLEAVAEKCRATASATEVVAIIEEAQRTIRAQPPASIQGAGPRPEVAAWSDYFAREYVALRRVLYHLRSNLALFTPGRLAWCQDERQAASRALRLPQIPGRKPAESMNAWLAFLATQVDPAVPLLGLLPTNGNWLDVIVGEPTPADFFVLRALPSGTPLITDIPYQLDADTPPDESGLLARLEAGQLPAVSCLNGEAAETNREVATKWLLRFRPSARPGIFRRWFNSGGA
jgi:hypothetical protein